MLSYDILKENLYLNQIFVLLKDNFGVSFDDFIDMLRHSYQMSLDTKSEFRTEPFTILNKETKEKEYYYCLFNGIYIIFFKDLEGNYLRFKTGKITKEYYETLIINNELKER